MQHDVSGLHALGFAIHWLKPKSKKPIGHNWQKGQRKSIEQLISEYKEGMNVGVRLGEPSHLTDGTYLHVIDLDVKSESGDDFNEAVTLIETFTGTKVSRFPQVISGRGGLSKHFYFKSDIPLNSFNLGSSPTLVKVKMPSVEPSKNDHKLLTTNELKAGFRMRPAWDIDLMGTGKQVVLPPSVHPDTGKKYRWAKPFTFKQLPKLEIKQPEKSNISELGDFTPKEINWEKLVTLNEKMFGLITEGTHAEEYGNDRSRMIGAVIAALAVADFPDDEILSILTEPEFPISEKTLQQCGSREAGAKWLHPQLQKAKKKFTVDGQFGDMGEELTEAEKKKREELQKQEDENKTVRNNDWAIKWGPWANDLEYSPTTKALKSSSSNVSLILRNMGKFHPYIGYNEFNGLTGFLHTPPWAAFEKEMAVKLKPKYFQRTLSDIDAVQCMVWLSKEFKIEMDKNKLIQILQSVALLKSFHPVKEYLKELKWDGVKRLDTWLTRYANIDANPASSEIGRITLVGAVKRIFEPGCKFETVLILEGEQGIFKSTLIEVLANGWFCGSLRDPSEKDVIGQMRGAWIVEIAELGSFRRADAEDFKAFLSTSNDKARMAYQTLEQIYPRQCIFIGTTNNTEYLKDDTGNRRYYPFKVDRIEIELLKAEKDQLWAEALMAYDAGEPCWVTNEETKIWATAQQKSRMIAHPWHEIIKQWSEHGANPTEFNEERVDETTAAYVLASVINKPAAHRSPGDLKIVATSLRALGWIDDHKRTGNFWKRGPNAIWKKVKKDENFDGQF